MKYKIKFLFNLLTLFIFIGSPSFILQLNASINDNQNLINDKNKYLEKSFYIIGPGDLLSIKFVGVEELSGDFTIMRDGNIQLPLIGSKNISGLTLDDAKQKIVELYKNELIRPEVDLTLLKSRPVRVTLIGEVQRPGSYTLDTGETSRVESSGSTGTIISGYKRVVDAIQKSGGLTFDADITNITLYRRLPGNEGLLKKVELDLLKMITTGDQTNNPILFDGDSIRIAKQTGEINKIENIPNNLTPENIKIHVIGEVGSPGIYQVDSKTNVSQAILIAGGPNSWRYKDKIQLLRVNRNGSVEVKKIAFNKEGLSRKIKNVSLRNGDIIRVNKNIFGKSTDALGTFLPPIRDMYTLYGVYKLID